MNTFFEKISSRSDINEVCRTDILSLPSPYRGSKKIKAILLGADPTNNGLLGDGLIVLDTVFGIGSQFETAFFKIPKTNIEAVGLSKENCYIQNVCRNYFFNQTSENPHWFAYADIWKEFLLEELMLIDLAIPILSTCAEVYEFFTDNKGPYTSIYKSENLKPFFSVEFKRNVLPLFRSTSYIFRDDKWPYRKFLINYFQDNV